MRTLCSQDCLLPVWGALTTFWGHEKAGVLAMSWGNQLFHFTVHALLGRSVPLGPDKMLFEVDPSRLPRTHNNLKPPCSFPITTTPP